MRAHVLLCMLAYYMEWHLRQALAHTASPVAPARRSARAGAKARHQRLEDGTPVHSFQTLLKDLATLARHRVQPQLPGVPAFDMLTRPTPQQDGPWQYLVSSWTAGLYPVPNKSG
ncbi:MAG: hypothetical protein AB1445_01815 [Bacillota bacterium]